MSDKKNNKRNERLEKLLAAREKLRLNAEYRDPVRPEMEEDIPLGTVESESSGAQEEKNDNKIYLRVLVNLVLTIAALSLIIWLLPAALRFFAPFVVAIIISAIANPLVKFLRKRLKFARKLSSVIVILLVVTAVAGILYGVGYFIVTEAVKLYDNRIEIMSAIEVGFNNAAAHLSGVYALLPETAQKFISGTSADLSKWFSGFVENIKLPSVSGAAGAVGSFADVLLNIIICLMASYFFTAQRDELLKFVKKWSSPETTEYFNIIADNFKKAIGGYFKAQFIIMVIVFVIMFIGFEILDVSFSGLVAFLVAFVDFLPVFGMGAILWPWIAIDLFSGNITRAIWLSVIYIICQLVRQLLQPKLVGDAVEMNPLATLFFMFVGYRVGSVMGMILGIPIGMLLISLYKIGAFDRIIRGIRILIKGINDFRKY